MAKPNFTQQTAANTITVKSGNQAAMTVTPAASVAPSTTSSPALPLSQLLLTPSAAPVILVPTSNVPTSTQGYPIGSVTPKANVNTQTLVVQPLQQASNTADKGPVPIQPKTAQGHRLPVQLPPRHPPPILPAPPNNSQAAAGGHNPPHIPVQLVGARQGLAGNTQTVALAQARNITAQENPVGGNVNVASNNSTMVGWLAGFIHTDTGLFSLLKIQMFFSLHRIRQSLASVLLRGNQTVMHKMKCWQKRLTLLRWKIQLPPCLPPPQRSLVIGQFVICNCTYGIFDRVSYGKICIFLFLLMPSSSSSSCCLLISTHPVLAFTSVKTWTWGQRQSTCSPGSGQTPSPHSPHRRLRHPGGSWAFSCKCTLPWLHVFHI